MTLQDLVIETITKPTQAAAKVCALATDRDLILTGFALNLVLGAFLYGFQSYLLGFPGNAMFPGLTPVYFGFFLAALQLSYAGASLLSARWLGGGASFVTTLGVLVWLRLVNIIVQVIAIIAMFVASPLAILLNMVAAIYGLYVLAHFTNVLFGLHSMAKSIGVILMAGFGAMAAVLLLMGFFAPTFLEASHV